VTTRRYFTCPRCGGVMPRGYVDTAGVEQWLCGNPGCGCTDRPHDASPRIRLERFDPWDATALQRLGRGRGVRPRRETGASAPHRGAPRPPTPAAPTLPERAWRWTGRTRVAAALAIAIMAVLIVGLVAVIGEYRDHSARSVYAYTLCRDGWISHSQGPGTCSSHDGVAQYVYHDVPAPSGGWSSIGR